jgi:hypothetical protein
MPTGLPGAPSVLWLPWVAGLAVGLGVLAGGLVWRARTAERRRIQRTVRRLSQESLRDVVIPDGIDGVLQIDRLLLTHRGVLTLDLRPYAGTLFGAERIDHWTQITKGGSYRFPNPLYENRLRVQAVRALLPGVPVQGRVVFTGEGWFANEPPAGVSRLETLARDLGLSTGGEVAPTYRAAWEVFKQELHAADDRGVRSGRRAGLTP